MIRILFFVLIAMTLSWAKVQHYFIRLGSFKQLNGLKRSIDNLPYDLRSHVIVVRSNGWYVPFAYNTPRRSSLQRKLPEFKRYFPDAYINTSRHILHAPIVLNYTQRRQHTPSQPQPHIVTESAYVVPLAQQNVAISQEDYTQSYPERPTIVAPDPVQIHIPQPHLEEKEVSPTKQREFTKKMLSGNHYYLAYRDTEESNNLLVKVKFENHKVTYQPIIGDMQLADANYIVDNHRLYMYADSFSLNGAYSKIEEPHKKYILVSSWSGGKKLNTLRYYYHLDDAKHYLGLLGNQDPLSSALLEGDDFDSLDIEDENY
jgi:hypothetical protein